MDFIDNYKPIYDIIFMDIRMPLMNGLTSSDRIVTVTPPWKIVLYVLDGVLAYAIYLGAVSPLLLGGKKGE